MSADLSEVAIEKEDGSIRRCILSGERLEREQLLRLVLSSEFELLPDFAAKLPGRGLWVSLNRELLEAGIKNGKLAKVAARGFAIDASIIQIPANSGAYIDQALSAQALRLLGLERRAGNLSLGFEKAKADVASGKLKMLFIASDAGPDAVQKMSGFGLQARLPIVRIFDRTELSLAVGRENVVHAALKQGGVTKSLPLAIERLGRFRGNGAQEVIFESRQEGKRAE